MGSSGSSDSVSGVRQVPVHVMLLALLAFSPGCSLVGEPEQAQQFRDEVLPVACGTCIYKIEGARGCFWSVQLGEEVFPLEGPVPEDHQAHGPEGMCVQQRRARVTGQVHHGQFQASAFELLPVDPSQDGPKVPHEHVH